MELTESGRKSPKRLLIDINEEDHRLIKEQAAKRNITMRKWILRALAKAIEQEKKHE